MCRSPLADSLPNGISTVPEPAAAGAPVALSELMWSLLVVWPAGVGTRNCARPARGTVGLAVATLAVLVATGQVGSVGAHETLRGTHTHPAEKKCDFWTPCAPKWGSIHESVKETNEKIESSNEDIAEKNEEALARAGMTVSDWVFVGLSIVMEMCGSVIIACKKEGGAGKGICPGSCCMILLLIVDVGFSVGKIFPPFTQSRGSWFINCQPDDDWTCQKVTHICSMSMASWWFAVWEWWGLCDVYKDIGASVSSTIPKLIQYVVSLVFIIYEAVRYPAQNTSTQAIIVLASLAEISLVFLEAFAFFKYRKQNTVQDIGMVESVLVSTVSSGSVMIDQD